MAPGPAKKARAEFAKQAAEGSQLVSGSQDKTVRVWKVADGSVVRQLTTPAPVNDVAFTKDGDPVYQWLTGTNPVPVTRSLIYTRIRHIHELIEKVSPLVYGFSGPDFADKFLWWPDEDDPMPEA